MLYEMVTVGEETFECVRADESSATSKEYFHRNLLLFVCRGIHCFKLGTILGLRFRKRPQFKYLRLQ